MAALTSAAGAASKVDGALELQRQGKLESARDLLATAAQEYRAAGDSANLARALGVAADISVSLGRYDDAIREAEEAVKLRTVGKDTARAGDDYNTAGMAYQYKGDYPAALAAYRSALAADTAAGDGEGVVTRLNNIGNVYYFQGRYADAIGNYEEARAKLQAEAPWFAAKRKLTLANLAVVFQRLGQEQRALDLYQQMEAPAALPGEMPAVERAQLLLNQGVLYRRLGDPVKALELYRAAQHMFQADRHADGEVGALRNIGIVQAMELHDAAGAVDSFTRALSLAQQAGNRRGAVQARLYRGELYRQQGRAEAAADLQDAWSGAQQAGLAEEQWKSRYALGRLAEDGGRTAEAETDYQAAIGMIESVRGKLTSVALRTDFLADKRDVYDSLIALRLRDPASSAAEIFGWMERSRARTLVDRTRGGMHAPEVRLEEIERRLAPGTVLAEFWVSARRRAAVWITRDGAGLVRALDTDILKGIPLAQRLIVVPDGSLSALPFETLPLSGSGLRLVEKCEVWYLPAASFLRATAAVRWRAPWSTTVVALADPLVTRDPFEEHWPPLPESANEARSVAEELAGRAEIHLGLDMRKRYVAARAPVLHLATHATVDAANPERSRILFANEYLLLGEVYDLKLAGVDLVTLSACDTAQGSMVAGEGVQAFGQAFLAAGAASVVTTLWRVADGPTADFMRQFYFGLSQGESKAAALREAKVRFLHAGGSLADERNWAAFVLTGDGAAPIPRAVPWSWCLLGAAVVLAAGVMWARH